MANSRIAFLGLVASLASSTALGEACPFPAGVQAINARWQSVGGAGGSLLGRATSEVLIVPGRDGCFQHYQSGSIYWTAPLGAKIMHGAIRVKWAALGWERSFLRWPLDDERPTPDGQGFFQHFQGGSIYWHPSTGAFEVHGDIRQKWANIGWERSLLGYPVTDETTPPDGVGRFNHFQNGSIYWKPSLGPHWIIGTIRNYWASRGWERNPELGYPISDELSPRAGSPNRGQDFENGYVYWRSRDNTAIELSHFPIASRDREQMQNEMGNSVRRMLQPHSARVYLDGNPTIVEITDYSRTGLDNVRNRMYKLNIPIKYHASFLGIDEVAPDPSTSLDVWILMNTAKVGGETRIQSTLWSWNARTHVPFPTSLAISAETINNRLRNEVMNGVTGKTDVVGTVPGSLNVLSAKVMPNGDFRVYIEPVF